MTSYIPRLSRFTTRSRSGRSLGHGGLDGRSAGRDFVKLEALTGVVPVLRRRLDIPATFSDEAILASLSAIASRPSYEQRWRAGEASTLGSFLQSHGRDLRACLTTLLSLLPRPPH